MFLSMIFCNFLKELFDEDFIIYFWEINKFPE